MANVVRYQLVQRVRVRRGVADKALVVIFMVSSKLHFRIEGEMVSVFFERVHVVAECVVRPIRLWQDVGEHAVAHANAEKPFDISVVRGRSMLPETLKRRQKKHAASRFQHIATVDHNTPRNFLYAVEQVNLGTQGGRGLLCRHGGKRGEELKALGDSIGSGQAPPPEDLLRPGFQRSGDDRHGRETEGCEVSQSIRYLSRYAGKQAFETWIAPPAAVG